jgi:hypothetical protein
LDTLSQRRSIWETQLIVLDGLFDYKFYQHANEHGTSVGKPRKVDLLRLAQDILRLKVDMAQGEVLK